MSCTLNKFTTYGVQRVIHNNTNGTYTATLTKAPTSCPDTSFTSKKAEVKVVEGIQPQLTFDVAKNHAVIVVPTTAYVEEVGSTGFGMGFYMFVFAVLGLGAYLLLRSTRSSGPSLAYSGGSTGPSTGGGGGGTTVINNGGSNDGLLTGMMIGSMMSNNRSERIVENNTTIIERDSSSGSDYSSDSSDDSSSFSSDSNSDSSFSSDSDSGSSFSSDSGGSDFSSDSGGSFSSDS